MFVLPTRTDIWGLVINEAMAAGLPIVTTDRCVAGMEMIEDAVNGYIVPVNDDQQLAARCVEILSNEMLSRQMKINNLEKIKDYTVEKMAEVHLRVFERFLKT